MVCPIEAVAGMAVNSNCQQLGAYLLELFTCLTLRNHRLATLALSLTEFILGSRASHAKTRSGRRLFALTLGAQ